jgi:hypothetical protein
MRPERPILKGPPSPGHRAPASGAAGGRSCTGTRDPAVGASGGSIFKKSKPIQDSLSLIRQPETRGTGRSPDDRKRANRPGRWGPDPSAIAMASPAGAYCPLPLLFFQILPPEASATGQRHPLPHKGRTDAPSTAEPSGRPARAGDISLAAARGSAWQPLQRARPSPFRGRRDKPSATPHGPRT